MVGLDDQGLFHPEQFCDFMVGILPFKKKKKRQAKNMDFAWLLLKIIIKIIKQSSSEVLCIYHSHISTRKCYSPFLTCIQHKKMS